MDSYQAFDAELSGMQSCFPKLKTEIDQSGKHYLRGEIDIIDLINGIVWETYLIEVHCSEEYPYAFPKVYEKTNKIPPIPDWHINLDGSCCIKVHPEELLVCQHGISLHEFLASQVIPYFYNQTHRKIEGYYVNGERPHGEEGIAEFYKEEFGTTNLETIIRCLNFIALKRKPNRTSACFCGRNTKFRKCHRGAFEKLSALSEQVLLLHSRMLMRLNTPIG